jgi:hypothetical protein
MIKNIISVVLLILSVSLSFKHGWDTLNYKSHLESGKMMQQLGISEEFIPFLGILSVLVGVLLLIPQTYFFGNIVNAMTIVLIMGLALKAGNFKIALMEIPFLAIPLIMIWLKYPFKN